MVEQIIQKAQKSSSAGRPGVLQLLDLSKKRDTKGLIKFTSGHRTNIRNYVIAALTELIVCRCQ